MDDLVLYAILAAIAFFVGRGSQAPKIAQAQAETKEAQAEIKQAQAKVREIQDLFEETLRDVRNDTVLLPSLVRWSDRVQEAYDEAVAVALRTKKHPARKASQEVRIARAER